MVPGVMGTGVVVGMWQVWQMWGRRLAKRGGGLGQQSVGNGLAYASRAA